MPPSKNFCYFSPTGFMVHKMLVDSEYCHKNPIPEFETNLSDKKELTTNLTEFNHCL